MNRWILVIAAVAAACTLQRATSAAGAEVLKVSTVLTVDGAPCGSVMRLSGGDMQIAGTAATPGTGKVVCAPLRFDVALPVADPLARLLAAMCTGLGTSSRLVVSDVTGTGTNSVRTLEYLNAVLTEVHLPSGQQGSSGITLVFQGTSSRLTEAPSTVAMPPPVGSGMGISHAVVEIPRVAPLGPPTQGIIIRRKTSSSSTGNARTETTPQLGPIEASPLTFTLRADQCGELNAWRDEAVRQGSPLPRNGKLTYFAGASGPVPAKPVLILHLTGVGMSKVEFVPIDAPEPRRMAVELSCQGVCIEFPVSAPPAKAAPRGA